MKKIWLVVLVLIINVYITKIGNAEELKNQIWQGDWIFNRYSSASGGSLNIFDCTENFCNFKIATYNGAHTCDIEGKLKTNGTTGNYTERLVTVGGKFENANVNFNLDTKKNIIKVTSDNDYNFFCGMNGYFVGDYENEKNPLRYNTGFDCWNKNLTETEKTICASPDISIASKELIERYKFIQTKEWYNNREKCHANEKCLWDFYVFSIKSGYEKRQGKSFDLYEYMGALSEQSLYYPTDFAILKDYFKKNMSQDDYQEWIASFSQISSDSDKCENCHYHEYGLAGLYTIVESVFYINKQNEIWLAFLHNDKKPNNNCITFYTIPEKNIKDIPPVFNKWLERVKPYFPNNIKLKHFKTAKNK